MEGGRGGRETRGCGGTIYDTLERANETKTGTRERGGTRIRERERKGERERGACCSGRIIPLEAPAAKSISFVFVLPPICFWPAAPRSMSRCHSRFLSPLASPRALSSAPAAAPAPAPAPSAQLPLLGKSFLRACLKEHSFKGAVRKLPTG